MSENFGEMLDKYRLTVVATCIARLSPINERHVPICIDEESEARANLERAYADVQLLKDGFKQTASDAAAAMIRLHEEVAALQAEKRTIARMALERIGELESGVRALPRRCQHATCGCTACKLYEVLD